MTPAQRAAAFLARTLLPGLDFLARVAPHVPDTASSRALLLAIAGQESDWTAWVQGGGGPARGPWQFERAGGVRGVIHHPASAPILRDACAALGQPVAEVPLWSALASPANGNLAVAMARLLLWTDVAPLPVPDDTEGCWDYYDRNWRPGSPRPSAWPGNLDAALAALDAAPDAPSPAHPAPPDTPARPTPANPSRQEILDMINDALRTALAPLTTRIADQARQIADLKAAEANAVPMADVAETVAAALAEAEGTHAPAPIVNADTMEPMPLDPAAPQPTA